MLYQLHAFSSANKTSNTWRRRSTRNDGSSKSKRECSDNVFPSQLSQLVSWKFKIRKWIDEETIFWKYSRYNRWYHFFLIKLQVYWLVQIFLQTQTNDASAPSTSATASSISSSSLFIIFLVRSVKFKILLSIGVN